MKTSVQLCLKLWTTHLSVCSGSMLSRRLMLQQLVCCLQLRMSFGLLRQHPPQLTHLVLAAELSPLVRPAPQCDLRLLLVQGTSRHDFTVRVVSR